MKRIIFLLLLCAAVCVLPACGGEQLTEEEATAYLEEYYAADMEEGREASIGYVYFKEDWETGAYMDSGSTVYEYSILDCERVNNALYAFSMEAHIDYNYAERYYNFVMAFEDRLYVVTNARNIPESVCKADDLEKYSDGSGTIEMEDIVGKVG